MALKPQLEAALLSRGLGFRGLPPLCGVSRPGARGGSGTALFRQQRGQRFSGPRRLPRDTSLRSALGCSSSGVSSESLSSDGLTVCAEVLLTLRTCPRAGFASDTSLLQPPCLGCGRVPPSAHSRPPQAHPCPLVRGLRDHPCLHGAGESPQRHRQEAGSTRVSGKGVHPECRGRGPPWCPEGGFHPVSRKGVHPRASTKGVHPGCREGSTPVPGRGPPRARKGATVPGRAGGTAALWAHKRLCCLCCPFALFTILYVVAVQLLSCEPTLATPADCSASRASLPSGTSRSLQPFYEKSRKPPLAPGPCGICLTAFGSGL